MLGICPKLTQFILCTIGNSFYPIPTHTVQISRIYGAIWNIDAGQKEHLGDGKVSLTRRHPELHLGV